MSALAKNILNTLKNNIIPEDEGEAPIENFTIEQRLEKSKHLMAKYPGRVPIIVRSLSPKTVQLIRNKYLTPGDLTAGQLLYVIRKNIKNIKPVDGLFIFCGKELIGGPMLLSTLYEDKKSEDGFLYLTICSENTFG